VATAWVRQRGRRIVGVRKLEQLQGLLGSLDMELSAEQLSRLDEASRIELGFPSNLLRAPVEGQMVYSGGALPVAVASPPQTSAFRVSCRVRG
jgi:hypothetical protein